MKPTRSDFVADVELCVKKILMRHEQELFYKLRDLNYLPEEEEEELYSLVGKLGREFEHRGIYPLKEYFQSKHIVPAR